MATIKIKRKLDGGTGTPTSLEYGELAVDGSGNLYVGTYTSGVAQVGGNQPIIPVTKTANHTLVLSDAYKVIEMDVATANTITVPSDSSVNFAIGTVIEIWQKGAGQTTIVAGSGVTIYTPSTLTLKTQYSSATLRKRAANEWVLAGDLG